MDFCSLKDPGVECMSYLLNDGRRRTQINHARDIHCAKDDDDDDSEDEELENLRTMSQRRRMNPMIMMLHVWIQNKLFPVST